MKHANSIPMSGRTGAVLRPGASDPLEHGFETGPAGGGTGTVPAAACGRARPFVQSDAPVPVLPRHGSGQDTSEEWPSRGDVETTQDTSTMEGATC